MPSSYIPAWIARFLLLLAGLIPVAADSQVPDEREGIPFELSDEEIAWIEAHPEIRLGVDPEFHPFEFIDEDGEYKGYAADYVRLLNERLGLNMVVQHGLSWSEVVDKAMAREIDALPMFGITEEREAFFDYTQAYVQFRRVIITDLSMQFLSGPEDLKNMRVGVQADTSHHGYLLENTEVEPVVFNTLEETVLAVAEGEVDAIVGNIAATTYWIRKLNLTNLKVAASADNQVFTLHFAVRKDWPILTGLLKKGLASISPRERAEISDRWFVLEYDPLVDYELAAIIGFIAFIAVVLLILWYQQTSRSRRMLVAALGEAENLKSELAAAKREIERLKAG